MRSKIVSRMAVLTVMALLVSMSAFAADKAELKIESPQNGATISPTPGLGNVVMIKFKTDNFKIMSLKDSMKMEHSAGMSNDQKSSDHNMSGISGQSSDSSASARSSSGNTPPAQDTATAPASDNTTSAENRDQSSLPQSGSMPQSDRDMDHKMMKNEGHVHVFVDDSPFYWVHSSTDPVVIVGLPSGSHRVKLELVGPNHMSTGVSQTVNFMVGGGR